MQALNNNEIKFTGAYEMDNFSLLRETSNGNDDDDAVITIERRCGRKRLKL